MHRRTFLSAALLSPLLARHGLGATNEHRLPASDTHRKMVSSFVEDTPIPEYHWASESAYEAFRDMKYGVRIHWGIYSVAGFLHESWPFLDLSFQKRARYNELYKTWNPSGFNADEWTSLFAENGMRMFAFTTKHHEGFSMFHTKTRVRQRIRWDAPGKPQIEDCDLAYSIAETPFRRDVVKELCDAGRKRGLRIALYFSHPDWYDADFRPYADDPVTVPSAAQLDPGWKGAVKRMGARLVMAPDPTPAQVARMMARHRAQLKELLTYYGDMQMLSLDQWLGPAVWPQLRETILELRRLQPNVMLRARGIGNYGDYYTPEGFVPGQKSNTDMPWMVIYPLARGFSFDPDGSQYKGAAWIIRNIVDTAAKGGSFQVGIGPDATGKFHPAAIAQVKEVGAWLRTCGKGVYATRPRAGDNWQEGNDLRFTRSKDGQTIYCFALAWPGASLQLRSLQPKGGSDIRMFGSPEPMKWSFDPAKGTTIELPESLHNRKPTEYAWGWSIRVNAPAT